MPLAKRAFKHTQNEHLEHVSNAQCDGNFTAFIVAPVGLFLEHGANGATVVFFLH